MDSERGPPGWMTHTENRLAEELECFTTEQLMSELARRMRVMREHILGPDLCEGCIHQRFWTKRGDPPHNFNPCGLGHALEFMMPDGPHADDGGFYRPGGCKDGKEPPPPPAPTPEPAPPRGGKPMPVP